MRKTEYGQARLANLDLSVWSSLQAFAETAGKWWLSVWVLLLLSGILTFGLTVANVRNFPTPVWVGLLLGGLVIAPGVAFHMVRVERDSFKHLWDDKEVIIRLLAELEDLRAEGARLHIEGRKAAKKQDIQAWGPQADLWYQTVLAKLGELHSAEAGNFRTLGVYTPRLLAGRQPLTIQHEKALENFVRRLDILGEIRDRWTTP